MKRQQTAATLLLLAGLALLGWMIAVEGEPGALPLLLVLAGGAWLVATRLRHRARRLAGARDGGHPIDRGR